MSDLAPYAAREEHSVGRQYEESGPQYRNEYQRDRDRIIHSAAFRRLEYKTQVFVNHEGDMFRTRLTHSIEVAQIGRTIARALRLNEDLTEAICLAHDLGHTPFGHAGQDVLNQCMRDYGGFEHNLQSLRVVDVLEERYADFPGLNLMYETREGIIKHCSRKNAKQLGDVGKRFLEGRQTGLEAQIANLADEVAYNNHDVDDGLRASLITIEQLNDCAIFVSHHDKVRDKWPDVDKKRTQHEIIRYMINSLVSDLIATSQANIENLNPATIDDIRNAKKVLITLSEDMLKAHQELKQFLRRNLYQHERVQLMTDRARVIIRVLFESYMDSLGQLPADARARASRFEQQDGEAGRARVVADYVAGMTDRFADAEYRRLTGQKADAAMA